jgi:hypothetical protein
MRFSLRLTALGALLLCALAYACSSDSDEPTGGPTGDAGNDAGNPPMTDAGIDATDAASEASASQCVPGKFVFTKQTEVPHCGQEYTECICLDDGGVGDFCFLEPSPCASCSPASGVDAKCGPLPAPDAFPCPDGVPRLLRCTGTPCGWTAACGCKLPLSDGGTMVLEPDFTGPTPSGNCNCNEDGGLACD